MENPLDPTKQPQHKIEEKIENQPSVTLNSKATRARHRRVFGTSSYIGTLFMKTKKILKNVFGFISATLRRRSRRFFSVKENQVVVKDPFKTFVRQTAAIACSLFIITSLPPTKILDTGFSADYFENTDFAGDGVEPELDIPSFIINDEGFLLKTAPASEDVSHIGFNDALNHTVVSGDTISGIAQLYGLSQKTILWENKLDADATLKIGQVLNIPPVDGVTHVVAAKGETLDTIAKQYNVDVSLIKDHNNLASDDIGAGQHLFIPGGTLKFNDAQVAIATRTSSHSATNKPGKTIAGRTVAHVETFDGSVDSSSSCSSFVFPTIGKINQGFKRGHLALDIGNPSQPDVWAACKGVVVKVVTGCPMRDVRVDRTCGGGYGNYVIVDHGGNMQTLYAHMEKVYSGVGDKVNAGTPLGEMGNSGRVYGPTGIHTHFEVRVDGVKKNPSNYL